MKIHNPDAPADHKTAWAFVSDEGNIQLRLVNDSGSSYATFTIERQGQKVIRVVEADSGPTPPQQVQLQE